LNIAIEIVDLPLKNGDFPKSKPLVRLPEGKQMCTSQLPEKPVWDDGGGPDIWTAEP
jgi:hypothetical protein